MGRIGTAFRAFFRALKNAAFAEQVRRLLDGEPVQQIAEPAPVTKPAAPVTPVKLPPQRNEALTLLAGLQHESRLVDFLMETIAGYVDQNIGAAITEIHRDASSALER